MRRLALICLVVMMIIPVAFAEEEVVVQLPTFEMTLNGTIVENGSEPYPFIEYKGITYLPMTWDLSYALGLETEWSEITGLQIKKRDKMKPYAQTETTLNQVGKKYKASIVSFPVNVNGKQVDNETADYPLLNFKNVTYFPMTYDYMVNEFNAGYLWDDQKGLLLGADVTLDKDIPAPHQVIFNIDFDEITDTSQFTDEIALIKMEGDLLKLNVFPGLYPEYDGYIVDVTLEYLDELGQVIASDIKTSRFVYDGSVKTEWPLYSKYIHHSHYADKVNVIIDIEPEAYTRARLLEKYGDLAYSFYSDTEITLEALKKDGAAYLETIAFSIQGNSYPEDLLRFEAAEYYAGAYKPGDETPYKILTGREGLIFNKVSDRYIALSGLTSVFIDPTQEKNLLSCKNGDDIVYAGNEAVIRLYNKDKKLIKVLIRQETMDTFFK